MVDRHSSLGATIRAIILFVASCALLGGLAYYVVGAGILLVPLLTIPVAAGVWVARAIMRLSGAPRKDEDAPPPIPTGRGE